MSVSQTVYYQSRMQHTFYIKNFRQFRTIVW